MSPRRSWIPGSLVLVAVCVSAAAGLAQDAARKPVIEREESWQVIEMLGQRVGYGRSEVAPVDEDGRSIVKSDSEVHMLFKRFGQKIAITVLIGTRETPEGDVLSFEYVTQNPPAAPSRIAGVVDGGQLTLTTTVDGKAKTATRTWKSEWKSPAYQDRVLREQPLKAGDQRSFEAYLPEFAKAARIDLKAGAVETIKLLEGPDQSLQKVTVRNSLLPGIPMDMWLDDKGRALKTSTSLLGTDMITYTVSKTEALKSLDGEELDFAVGTLVKVQAIPDAYTLGEVVYKISLPSPEAVEALPDSLNQHKKPLAGNVVELRVTRERLPATAAIKPAAAEFTGPTKFLQSDDDEVRKHARAAVGDATDPVEKCRRMEKYVAETLKNKNFSTAMASAGEVARTLEGDCTEHAVLLAAMLRAEGIPSRVAVGLVYVASDPNFGGHMWTEACLDGEWHALDGTLGRGGTTAVHLKLGDSSLAEEGLSQSELFVPLVTILGKLQIEVVSVKE